jgi:hypothetical protein
MKRSALCLVDTEDQAATIVEKLRSAGFSDSDISVLFPDKGSTREFAHKKETKMPQVKPHRSYQGMVQFLATGCGQIIMTQSNRLTLKTICL